MKREKQNKVITKKSEEFTLSCWREYFNRLDYGQMCREEGYKEGQMLALAELVNNHIISIENAADHAGMTVEDFRKAARSCLK